MSTHVNYSDPNYLNSEEFSTYEEITTYNQGDTKSFTADTTIDSSAEYTTDDYYDYSFSSRIRRFHRPMYYSGYYGGIYTDYYWYNNDPFSCGTSIYYGYNWLSPYYYPYYSYSPFYFDYYSPYYYWNYYSFSHHYHPYHNTYHNTNNNNAYITGHRGSLSSNGGIRGINVNTTSQVPTLNIRDNNTIKNNTINSRNYKTNSAIKTNNRSNPNKSSSSKITSNRKNTSYSNTKNNRSYNSHSRNNRSNNGNRSSKGGNRKSMKPRR